MHAARPIALVALLLVTAFAAAPAWAQSTALLGITGDDIGLVSDVEDGVRAGLAAAPGHEPVPADVSDLDEALLLIGCPTASPDCLSDLASVLDVDHLVYGRVMDTDDGPALSITCFDAAIGTWSFSSNVPLFDPADAARVAEDATRALLADAPVLVVTGPPGAVLVDGLERRALPTVIAADGVTTAWDVEALGAPVGVVRAPAGSGARVARVSPTVVSDTPAAGAHTGGSASTLRVTGWSLAGVTVGLAGATLAQRLAMGRTQRAFDRTRIQRDAHELADQGASQARTANTLLGFTLVTAAAAGTLLVLEYTGNGGESDTQATTPAQRASVGVMPTRGGAHGSVRWSF